MFILSNNDVRLWCWGWAKELQAIIDSHVVHVDLHWTKEVVIKVSNVNCLMYNYVVLLACHRMLVGYSAQNNLVLFGPQGSLVSLDVDRCLVIM